MSTQQAAEAGSAENAPGMDTELLDAAEAVIDGNNGGAGSDAAPAPASPFALTDAHEFPTQQAQDQRQTARITAAPSQSRPSVVAHAGGARASSGVPSATPSASPSHPSIPTPPPAWPGTSESPYRRCPCLAVLPGRVCSFCLGSRWTRTCPHCLGDGRVQISVRRGAERSEPCGFCMTRGILPATPNEIRAAEAAARMAGIPVPGDGGDYSADLPDTPPAADSSRRAVRLPSIGAVNVKPITQRKRRAMRGRKPRGHERGAAAGKK